MSEQRHHSLRDATYYKSRHAAPAYYKRVQGDYDPENKRWHPTEFYAWNGEAADIKARKIRWKPCDPIPFESLGTRFYVCGDDERTTHDFLYEGTDRGFLTKMSQENARLTASPGRLRAHRREEPRNP